MHLRYAAECVRRAAPQRLRPVKAADVLAVALVFLSHSPGDVIQSHRIMCRLKAPPVTGGSEHISTVTDAAVFHGAGKQIFQPGFVVRLIYAGDGLLPR